MLWTAEDLDYLDAASASELRELVSSVGRQIQGWICSMQAPDFARGPKYHQEPAQALRQWEALLEQQGLVRLPDGSFSKRKQTEDGKTE